MSQGPPRASGRELGGDIGGSPSPPRHGVGTRPVHETLGIALLRFSSHCAAFPQDAVLPVFCARGAGVARPICDIGEQLSHVFAPSLNTFLSTCRGICCHSLRILLHQRSCPADFVIVILPSLRLHHLPCSHSVILFSCCGSFPAFAFLLGQNHVASANVGSIPRGAGPLPMFELLLKAPRLPRGQSMALAGTCKGV